MAAFTVNDDVFKTPAAQEYFGRADKRVMVGVRAALELLGIPLPEYAVRKPAGRPRSAALVAAYNAERGITQKPKVPEPLSERRQAAQLRNAQERVGLKRTAQGLAPRDWGSCAAADTNNDQGPSGADTRDLFNDIFNKD